MGIKRIIWKKSNADSNIYKAFNKTGEFLGFLSYERIGQFMHWCWYQIQDIRMSPGCLEEVREMQKQLIKIKNNPQQKLYDGR